MDFKALQETIGGSTGPAVKCELKIGLYCARQGYWRGEQHPSPLECGRMLMTMTRRRREKRKSWAIDAV